MNNRRLALLSRDEIRAQAIRENFYWAPCPVCGEWAGGQEKPHGYVRFPGMPEGTSVLTCPRCQPTHADPYEDIKVVDPHWRHAEWRKEQGI